MADELTEGIDRFFGTLDKVTDGLGAFFGRAEQSSKKADAARAEAQRGRAERAAKAEGAQVQTAGVVKRAPFRIEDVIDADTGAVVYVVTNGVDKVDCPSRALAERTLRAFEGEP